MAHIGKPLPIILTTYICSGEYFVDWNVSLAACIEKKFGACLYLITYQHTNTYALKEILAALCKTRVTCA